MNPEVLAEVALARNLDSWDLAILVQHAEDSQRQLFTRDFSLDDLTETQCKDHFRFSREDILRLHACFRMPQRMMTANRVSASGNVLLAC
jgi:hypothetical protein